MACVSSRAMLPEVLISGKSLCILPRLILVVRNLCILPASDISGQELVYPPCV